MKSNGLSDEQNKFICDLAERTKGNTLVLFQFVEKRKSATRNVKDSKKPITFYLRRNRFEQREAVRKLVEETDDSIIIASTELFQ